MLGSIGGALGTSVGFYGYPANGLRFLYPCDERNGDKLKDVMGNMPDMQCYTGSALDCAGNIDISFIDSTGWSSEVDGMTANGVAAAEIFFPAVTGTSHYEFITSSDSATGAPIELGIREVSSRWRVVVRLKTQISGVAQSETQIEFSSSDMTIVPETWYQVVAVFNSNESTATLFVRAGNSGPWLSDSITITSGATNEFYGNYDTRLLSAVSNGTPFTGKVMRVILVAGLVGGDEAVTFLERPSTSYLSGFGNAYRMWDFSHGHGSLCHEVSTHTWETISGTYSWETGISGCSQNGMRQGASWFGKYGFKIGGEDNVLLGGGADTGLTNTEFLSSADGWSFAVTVKVGVNPPIADGASATSFIAGAYGPETGEAAQTDRDLMPGAILRVNTSGGIYSAVKEYGISSASSAVTGNVGPGSGASLYRTQGLTTTYVMMTSPGEEGYTVYRVSADEPTPVEINISDTGEDYTFNRARGILIGNDDFTGDAVVGFIAGWNRPLSESEIVQCHLSARRRMEGQELYVSASSVAGDGTELRPYSNLTSGYRMLDGGQVLNVLAGSYTPTGSADSNLYGLSSFDGVDIRGVGADHVTILPYAASSTAYPFLSESGSVTLRGITFDADGVAAYAVRADEECESIILHDCVFVNAYAASSSSGTGLVSRAFVTKVYDCESYGNDEHGVYIRNSDWGDLVDLDRQFVVDGLYCHDNVEDGLKVTNESGSARFINSLVNNLHVVGGKNQCYLLGMYGGVVSNVLLLGQSNAGTAALYIGYPPIGPDGDTEFLTEDVLFSNITVFGATGRGVWNRHSSNCQLRNVLVHTAAAGGFVDEEGTLTDVAYCASQVASSPFPTGSSNIPSATITFTDAGSGDYTLQSSSDGYGKGLNLYNFGSEELQSDLAGTARPSTGMWNMGAY